jgi:hypothetical protein
MSSPADVSVTMAPIHSPMRSGWREASSSTVAMAEGPVSKGTAGGNTKGSRPGSRLQADSPLPPKIMRIAMIRRITPPATSRLNGALAGRAGPQPRSFSAWACAAARQ